MKNILVGLAVAAALAGCASTPKQQLSQASYKMFARDMVVTLSCGQSGYISSDQAAMGIRYIKASLAQFAYDDQQLKSSLTEYATTHSIPSQGDCNGLAMQISEINQQQQANIAQSQANAAEMQNLTNQLQNAVPKPIYCNRIGTQTFCQ